MCGCRSVYWKEKGLFLLHILRNVTANDEAVEFLLLRRMKTLNKLMCVCTLHHFQALNLVLLLLVLRLLLLLLLLLRRLLECIFYHHDSQIACTSCTTKAGLKEQGQMLLLLLLLPLRTAADAFVSCVVLRLRDLLRHLPPLCQAPFLLLALRLACREQLHPLLLPVDHNKLQQTVQKQYSQQQQQQQEPSPEEDCRLLLALCCFLYPKPDSVERAKARDELVAQDAEEDKQRQQQRQQQDQEQQQQKQQQMGVTERQRLRFLHPTVDVRSSARL